MSTLFLWSFIAVFLIMIIVVAAEELRDRKQKRKDNAGKWDRFFND